MNYTATKFDTAENKGKFEKQFKRFVERGFSQTLFTKSFYQRISNMRGHIAHYDRSGFWNAQFSTPECRADFLRHWTNSPIYGNPEYTWSDVECVLAAWLKEHPEYEQRERKAHSDGIEQIERDELARLTTKYAQV
jgi:hypothetical protein